jgi:hypothetical protein
MGGKISCRLCSSNTRSIVADRFTSKWKRSATCCDYGAPSVAPSAYRPQYKPAAESSTVKKIRGFGSGACVPLLYTAESTPPEECSRHHGSSGVGDGSPAASPNPLSEQSRASCRCFDCWARQRPTNIMQWGPEAT